MYRSQEFIQENRKKLNCGPDFFNPDTSLMPREQFDKARVKVLIVFPTPHSVKTVSSTAAALNDFIIAHCPDVFVDFAYMPDQEDVKIFDDARMPYCIGNITHLDASHFDIVGFSISVLSEIVNAPVMLKSCERCDKPIPLFWSERKDMKIGETPVVYCGGITAACGDLMFGKVGNNQAFLDFQYLGSCDAWDILLSRYMEAKENGSVTRLDTDRDVVGYAHEEIEKFEKVLKVNTIQDYIESLFDLNFIYHPQGYNVVFNKDNQIIENTKINPKCRNFVKPLYPHKLLDDLGIGRTIINADGDNTGTTQTQLSEGCSAGGHCSFCAEGAYTGGWVEKDREQIIKEVKEAKKYSAGYKYKGYSFNMNYVTDYKGLLYELMQLYPKVTFINMRLEELGRDTDALKMMKLIGSNRISAPIEGISPRIQNNLLNKCLSLEALDNFMEDLIHLKMTDIKVGGIFTAYEEDEDFQWICDYVQKFKKKARENGGNLPWRLKVTPLVHYPLTTCEYLERKSAKKSYLGEHWLTDEWYEKFRENEVFFKVNGFRYSTFIEQALVDLGRSITPMIYKHFVKETVPIYSLRSVAKDEFVEELKSFVNPDTFFALRDPEKYISIAHRIHIDLMGSYIPRARRLIRAYQNGNIFDNEPDIRCLKTYEGAKVKCHFNCIKEEPLKIYNDVKMDEEGNLHGDFRNLLGCERCETPDLRKARLTRPTPQTKNSEDIMACPRIPKIQKLRFTLRRVSEYDVLNPNNTAHTFVTKFLQKSDNLLEKFHSIVNHNLFWQADPQVKYYVSGLQVVDTVWSGDVIKEIKSLIEEVNTSLKSVQVVSVEEVLMDEKIKVDDYNVFYFESSLPLALFESSMHSYEGQMKIFGGMGGFETIKDPSLMKPVFASKGKVCGCFAIPAKYNPLQYLSGFLTAKKTSVDVVAQTTKIDCKMIVRETQNVCKKCGKEKSIISVTTGKALPFGVECVCKALLSQIIK